MNLQRLPRLLLIVCLSIGMLTAGVARASAQGNTLPDEIITANDLSQAQKDRVAEFVNANKAGLRAGPIEIKRSRNSLLQPFNVRGISVAFRLEYTRQLTPVLRPLISDPDGVIAVNALRIVGELATANSVDMLVEALKDKRPGVRYAAASGLKDTFKAMQSTVPAVGGAQALRMLDTLKSAIQGESDPRVLEGLVGAYQEAIKIPHTQVEGMRGAAVKSLAEAISAKIATKRIGPEADAALRKAILAIRTSVIAVNINEPQLTPDVARVAAGMAGDLLTLAMDRLKQPDATGDADLALMVNESEKTIFFMLPIFGSSSNFKELKLGDLVQEGKKDEYQQKVLQIIGPNGILTDAPFNFPNNRFVK